MWVSYTESDWAERRACDGVAWSGHLSRQGADADALARVLARPD
jgi:hypothetical protein